ncbi:MAG: rhodanese-like domain-containing protein [Saprospiraceae bacterium]|nr:rhodanese-like domain-containing protein [Saprospiraceae bacterium]
MYQNFILFFSLLTLLIACNPGDQNTRNTTYGPGDLLLEIADDRRFISTDDVADRIINKDPSIQLIDVRSAKEYQEFALPDAINIPLEGTFEESARTIMNFEKYTFIFYSNDDIIAEDVWILNRRTGCTDCYIMKGGLNKWVETIMDPKEPPATASSDIQELYKFRQAASRYFAGGSREMNPEPFYVAPKPATKKVVKLTPKKVEEEEEEEEGC